MEPYEETCYLWTRSEIRFRFTWERDSLRQWKQLVSGQRPTRSEPSGLSSVLGRSNVNAWEEMYGDRYELTPLWVRAGLM